MIVTKWRCKIKRGELKKPRVDLTSLKDETCAAKFEALCHANLHRKGAFHTDFGECATLGVGGSPIANCTTLALPFGGWVGPRGPVPRPLPWVAMGGRVWIGICIVCIVNK